MSAPQMSRQKAHSISFGLFVIGIGILFLFQSWWPSIALVVGIPIAVRQYLLGKIFDMIASLVIFIGIFLTVEFHFESKWYLPVLFITGGLYLVFREIFGGSSVTESEREQDINREIEEDKEP